MAPSMEICGNPELPLARGAVFAPLQGAYEKEAKLKESLKM